MSGLFEAPRSAGTLFLGGTKISGSDIRDQNVQATQAVARVMSSSFGPAGLDKMMVSPIPSYSVHSMSNKTKGRRYRRCNGHKRRRNYSQLTGH